MVNVQSPLTFHPALCICRKLHSIYIVHMLAFPLKSSAFYCSDSQPLLKKLSPRWHIFLMLLIIPHFMSSTTWLTKYLQNSAGYFSCSVCAVEFFFFLLLNYELSVQMHIHHSPCLVGWGYHRQRVHCICNRYFIYLYLCQSTGLFLCLLWTCWRVSKIYARILVNPWYNNYITVT